MRRSTLAMILLSLALWLPPARALADGIGTAPLPHARAAATDGGGIGTTPLPPPPSTQPAPTVPKPPSGGPAASAPNPPTVSVPGRGYELPAVASDDDDSAPSSPATTPRDRYALDGSATVQADAGGAGADVPAVIFVPCAPRATFPHWCGRRPVFHGFRPGPVRFGRVHKRKK